MYRLLILLLLIGQTPLASAADSYRWLHVTIDTPWAIFIFLLPMVLIPIVLMAILHWKFAFKSAAKADEVNVKEEAKNKGN